MELKEKVADGEIQINLGPTMEKADNPPPFVLKSGAVLSFGVAVRDHKQYTELIAFRFHYRHPNSPVLPTIRFDMRRDNHPDPLKEPRVHMHAAIEGIRLPVTLRDPFEILDVLFFAIDPHMPGGAA